MLELALWQHPDYAAIELHCLADAAALGQQHDLDCWIHQLTEVEDTAVQHMSRSEEQLDPQSHSRSDPQPPPQSDPQSDPQPHPHPPPQSGPQPQAGPQPQSRPQSAPQPHPHPATAALARMAVISLKGISTH